MSSEAKERANCDTAARPGQETILFVHGTWAEHKNEGEIQWWEKGSEFCEDLRARLPEGVTIDPSVSHFGWSAANSEAGRVIASYRLLDTLLRFERDGRPYHIVAHSHGGSIAWLALQHMAELAEGTSYYLLDRQYFQFPKGKKHLPNLRSLTTVGTPFLKTTPRLARNRLQDRVGEWLLGFLSFSVWIVVMAALGLLLAYAANSIIRALPHMFWLLSILIVVTAMALWLGFASALVLRLIRPVGVAITAWLGFKEDLRREERLSLSLRDRWLCIWSADDEAIASLRLSMHFERPRTPRIFSLTTSAQSSSDFFASVATTPFTLIYNKLVAPRLDALIWDSVRRSIQGSDRAGWVVTGISHAPNGILEAAQTLPPRVSECLRNSADAAAQAQTPKLRAFLAQIARLGLAVVGTVKDELFTGKELVHTNYFANPDVRSLIAFHLRRTGANQQLDSSFCNSDLGLWYGSRYSPSTSSEA